jgi:hypothetical protein
MVFSSDAESVWVSRRARSRTHSARGVSRHELVSPDQEGPPQRDPTTDAVEKLGHPEHVGVLRIEKSLEQCGYPHEV